MDEHLILAATLTIKVIIIIIVGYLVRRQPWDSSLRFAEAAAEGNVAVANWLAFAGATR